MTRSTTGAGRTPMENMPMYEPPGFHSVKRLGEPCAIPEVPSIGTSQTPKALLSASLNTVSRRPSRNCSPVSVIRCPPGALNTTDEEPPASGMDSTADSSGPLAKSTRSPSALQVADPSWAEIDQMSRRRAVEEVDRQVARVSVIRSSREPSGVEITSSVTGQQLARARQPRSGVGCRPRARDPSLCMLPCRTPRREFVVPRRSRRTPPFRACLRSVASRPCR